MEEVLKQLEGMSNRRRIASRAHSIVRQLSLTPSNPYELQLIHDILSQQRRLSSHSTSPTASPVPFAVPDLAHGAGNFAYIPPLYQQQQHLLPQQQRIPLGLASPVQQNNPFLEVVHNGHGQKMNGNIEDENRVPYNIQINAHSPVASNGNCVVEPAAPRMKRVAAPDCNGHVDPFVLNAVGQKTHTPNYSAATNPFQMNALLNAVNANAFAFEDPINANVKKQNNLPSNPIDLPGVTPLENGQNNTVLPLTLPTGMPVIAVTPPSVSSLLKPVQVDVRDGPSALDSSKSANVEEEAVLQDMNNFSPGEASVGGLPLLSALGIKSENNISSSSNHASDATVAGNS